MENPLVHYQVRVRWISMTGLSLVLPDHTKLVTELLLLTSGSQTFVSMGLSREARRHSGGWLNMVRGRPGHLHSLLWILRGQWSRTAVGKRTRTVLCESSGRELALFAKPLGTAGGSLPVKSNVLPIAGCAFLSSEGWYLCFEVLEQFFYWRPSAFPRTH